MSSFKLTQKQLQALELFTSQAQEILLYGGSRSAKTFFIIYAIITRALKAPGSRHAIFRHRFNHLRQSVIGDTLPKVIGLAYPAAKRKAKLSRTEWCLRFDNGSEIWFGGLDDKERTEKILGNEFSTIFFNEASEISYKAYTTALTRLAQKTALTNKIYIDCNPPAKGHWIYKKFIEFKEPIGLTPLSPQNLASLLMNPGDNSENISDDYLERLQALPALERDRFLYGLFCDTVTGGVYTKELSALEKSRHITALNIDENYPLHAVFDIGARDATAIWFVQFFKNKILFCDYYENNFEALPHYLKVIQDKGYRISTMFLPHDAKNRNWASGKSAFEVANKYALKLGFKVEVLPRIGIMEGINFARTVFSNIFFDHAKCARGIEALRNYRIAFNERLGRYEDTPLHDWASHGADAFRYACLAYSRRAVGYFFDKAPTASAHTKGFTFNDLKARLIK
ncbi:MAG: phage terminase large subunit [Elusimicrobia bacterium]|nr:phage terminase large subunit [Elusimicrobiota bacterium]